MTPDNVKPTILIIGPLSSTGGMATSMRLHLEGTLREDYHLVPLDNSKRTPVDRSPWQAVRAQFNLVLTLIQALRTHRPALVHIHTCSGLTFLGTSLDLLLSKLHGVRVVLHLRGGRFHEFLESLGGLKRCIVRAALVNADRVIVLGEVWEERLRRFDPRIQLAVIHNGIMMDGNGPETPTGNLMRIVLVGTTRQSKGIDDLIEAIGALPEDYRRQIEARIIGPDPDRRHAELSTRIRQVGLEKVIALCGEVRPQQVWEELRRASIFVLPSYAEGMPNALLEAMACGLPCIASAVGAVPELVRNDVDGILIQPGDTTRLAGSLLRLIRNPALRSRMGQSARLRVRSDFSQSRVCERLATLYRSILSPQGTPA